VRQVPFQIPKRRKRRPKGSRPHHRPSSSSSDSMNCRSQCHPSLFLSIVSKLATIEFTQDENHPLILTMPPSQTQKLVLALNAGSSSLKASVIRDEETVVSFLAERLSTPDASMHINHSGKPNVDVEREGNKSFDHEEALSKIIGYIKSDGMLDNLVAIGHRVVHGGTIFPESALVTDKSLDQIKSISHLAPL